MSFNVLERNSKLLPAFCKPYQDEALSSWLTRVSYGHGLQRSILLRLMGLECKSYTDWNIERYIDNEQINILAKYTNSQQAEIRNSTVKYYENSLFDASGKTPYTSRLWLVKTRRVVKSSSVLSHSGTLYCPSCFSRTGSPVYYKRDWQLIVSLVCLDCQCYLRECCPHCKNGPSRMNSLDILDCKKTIDDYLLTCNSCDNNISHCDPEPAPVHIIQLQRKINKYLRGNQIKCTSLDYFKGLHKISSLLLKQIEGNPFNDLIEDVFALYGIKCTRLQKISLRLQDLAVKKQADIFYIADQLLKDWPNPFLGLVRKRNLQLRALNHFNNLPELFRKPLEVELADYEISDKKTCSSFIDPYLNSHRIECVRNEKCEYGYNQDEEYYNGGLDIDLLLYDLMK